MLYKGRVFLAIPIQSKLLHPIGQISDDFPSATLTVAATPETASSGLCQPPVAEAFTPTFLRNSFWACVLGFGLAEFWMGRNAMNTDGISYLDVASAFMRHDWSNAVNAYWSPLYPFLLSLGLRAWKPAPYWEFTVVHLVNFLIFVASAASFEFFMGRLLLYRARRFGAGNLHGLSSLPEWAMRAVGYTLFLWSSIKMLPIAVVSPDATVALLVYLAAGIVIGMRVGLGRNRDFLLLGVVLGLGYLAKAPMLPVGVAFLVTALIAVRKNRGSMVRILASAGVAILIAVPFVLKLSALQGHVTWGDSAKLNYAWYVNQIPRYHWPEAPSAFGAPAHPTTKIFDDPPVYAFDREGAATYPIWFDPSYWMSGVRSVFDWKAISRQVVANGLVYYDVIFHQQAPFVVILLLLFLIGGRGKLAGGDVAEFWPLIVPAVAAFGMYVVVHVEERMIAAFLVLLWMAVFSAVRYRDFPETRRCAWLATITLALFTVTMIAASVPGEMASYGLRDLVGNPTSNYQWQVAEQLRTAGIHPGDKIAWLRPTLFNAKRNYAWARLAQVKIVAEVPTGEEGRFWESSSETQRRMFAAVAQTGAAAFVVSEMPSRPADAGWKPLGGTGYFVHLLR